MWSSHTMQDKSHAGTTALYEETLVRTGFAVSHSVSLSLLVPVPDLLNEGKHNLQQNIGTTLPHS